MASKKPVFSRASRSTVWDHFEKHLENEKTVVCKKTYAYHGGTSNLQSHLKSAHPSVVAADDSDAGKPTLAAGVMKSGALDKFVAAKPKSSAKPCSVATSEGMTQALVKWITTDMRPLNVVNDGGLQRLLALAQPGYSLPSRTHVASIVRRRHADGKEEIKTTLKSVEYVAVTTDSWTSKAVRSYSTFTVHFLSSEWKLRSFVLATRPLDGRHTADNLAKQFTEIVTEFGIAGKVIAVVHDEVPNMVAASRMLTEKLGVQGVVCAAHRLQTCLRHTLDLCKSCWLRVADLCHTFTAAQWQAST